MRILVAEDDARMAAMLQRGLREDGYSVDVAADGNEAIWQAGEVDYDAVILDVMLPRMSGYDVVRGMRAQRIWTPVLMLSAKDGEHDQADALDGGADDYLTKPFSFAELTARIDAIFRRVDRGGTEGQPTKLSVGDLEIDLLARSVVRQGRTIALGAREFNLLEYLARHAGQVVTRTMMLEKIWNYHFDPGSNVVDVHIGRLRRKIEEGFGAPILHTVRGAGYRLSVET